MDWWTIEVRSGHAEAKVGIWLSILVLVAVVAAPILLYWAAPAIGRPPGQILPNSEWRVDLRAHLRLGTTAGAMGDTFSSRTVPVAGFRDGSNWDGKSWQKEHDVLLILPAGVVITSNNIDNSVFILKDRWLERAIPMSYTGAFTRIQRGEHGFFVDIDLTELVAQIRALPERSH